LLTGSLIVLFVAVLLASASQALLVQSQDRLDDVQGEIYRQQAIAEQQRLQLAELQSPSRIVAVATERLGMVAPDEVVYLHNGADDDALISRVDEAVPEQVPAGETPGNEVSAGDDAAVVSGG
jgi:cell division protein FtsL